MKEELLPIDFEERKESIIKVIGVGGGGGNAVNHMIQEGIKGVDFIVCNTDAQDLEESLASVKIQLGESLTEGLGAGSDPERGREATIESLDEIEDALGKKSKMVFITAGMGGGTGTGAAPLIAKLAKDQGILTVGIVTIPFSFEGHLRLQYAYNGIKELEKYVDALLIIKNDKLIEMHKDGFLSESFALADSVLSISAKGIAEIITITGEINIDFADVKTVMENSGVAVMGSAKASGKDRAIKAIEEALNSPLLNSNDIRGAQDVLLNIISGTGENGLSVQELTQITDYVRDLANTDVNLIFGNGYDEKMDDQLNATIIATGFQKNPVENLLSKEKKNEKKVPELELVAENAEEAEEREALKRKEKAQRKEESTKKKTAQNKENKSETKDVEDGNYLIKWGEKAKRGIANIFDSRDTSME